MFGTLKSFFNPQQNLSDDKPVSSLDIVMYTAALASNPDAITTISDQIREVTAKIDPQHPVTTAEQEEKLKNIYLALETYLITNEPAQKFTKERLRERITQKMRLTSNQTTFWSNLPN